VKDPADFQIMQIQLEQKHEGKMAGIAKLKKKWGMKD
jgi:hypothetical protein